VTVAAGAPLCGLSAWAITWAPARIRGPPAEFLLGAAVADAALCGHRAYGVLPGGLAGLGVRTVTLFGRALAAGGLLT
jgi:hypothetical protein